MEDNEKYMVYDETKAKVTGGDMSDARDVFKVGDKVGRRMAGWRSHHSDSFTSQPTSFLSPESKDTPILYNFLESAMNDSA